MEKISGFSLVRNGIKFEYPFLESWRSLLPLVDELVINVGVSEDSTLDVARGFAQQEGQGKVKIIETHWPVDDLQKKKSGLILSEQTNLILDHCTHRWCFYLQADEVLHEDDDGVIRQSIHSAMTKKCEAVVFEYQHFYGSYNVIQKTRSSYRREIRIIDRLCGARSVGDAQSFRKPNAAGALTEKLTAVLSPARVFHYGWVRTPQAMKEKTVFMDQLYHGDPVDQTGLPHTGQNFKYKRFWGLREYQGTHPQVMKNRIQSKGWTWDLKSSPFVFTLTDFKKVVLDTLERFTGYRAFEFKNYKVR